MENNDNKKKTNLLNLEIIYSKFEKYASYLDKINKERYHVIGEKALKIIPTVIGVLGSIVFNNVFLALIGIGGSFISNYIIEMKNNNLKNNKNNKITKLEEEQDYDYENSKDEDFYTFDYKMKLKQVAIFKEDKEKEKITYDLLNKDDVKNKIIDEIKEYLKIYKIPPINITNMELDTYFDVLYNVFYKKGKLSEFYDEISYVERYTLAKSLVYNQKKIGLNDFVENLCYINKKIISKRELTKIKKEIMEKTDYSKTIDLKTYVENKGIVRKR